MKLATLLKYLAPLLVVAGISLIVFSTTDLTPSATPNSQSERFQSTASPQIQGLQPSSSLNNQTTKDGEKVLVTRVVDGDTIEIEGGQRVRYIGIDTPESTTTLQCYGKEATDFNRKLVEKKVIRLEKDVSETDKYGRLLRYVYIGDTFVNQYLVIQGYAHSSSYPPDIKYQDLFTQAEKEARENTRGLWGGCKADQKPNDCLIKGNISSSGEKIYHLPGQRYYDKTAIDESKGERWFCTEEDAQKSGWRKSKI